jgi:hypothetical protein
VLQEEFCKIETIFFLSFSLIMQVVAFNRLISHIDCFYLTEFLMLYHPFTSINVAKQLPVIPSFAFYFSIQVSILDLVCFSPSVR